MVGTGKQDSWFVVRILDKFRTERLIDPSTDVFDGWLTLILDKRHASYCNPRVSNTAQREYSAFISQKQTTKKRSANKHSNIASNNSTTTMARSHSIPIISSQNKDDESSAHQEAVMADYKDFVFFHRLVDGMQKKQNMTQDKHLRYQNQALIDHIIRTRHGQNTTSSSGRMPAWHGSSSTANLFSTVSEAVRLVNEVVNEDDFTDEEPDMIFELEI
jgi:hypothetical protein